MRSPGKRPLAFVAEYQFGDDNVLTATHHEEMRLKNEERVRNAKSILKMEGLTAGGETSPTHNLKKIQQQQDRLDLIDQHNLILLQRLERIHQHVPKQFDVSHHSEAVQNAPRASNIGLRRRQHDQIALENERMQRRLNNVKGTFNLKKLAADAERHEYFSDQLSKVGRRRKVQATVRHLTNLSAIKHSIHHDAANSPNQFYVYQHRPEHPDAVAERRNPHRPSADDDDDESDHDDRHNSLGPHQRLLPPVRASAARKYAPHASGSPTLTHTGKAISATALLHGFK